MSSADPDGSQKNVNASVFSDIALGSKVSHPIVERSLYAGLSSLGLSILMAVRNNTPDSESLEQATDSALQSGDSKAPIVLAIAGVGLIAANLGVKYFVGRAERLDREHDSSLDPD